MKKLLSFTLVVSLALFCVACGSGGTAGRGSAASSAASVSSAASASSGDTIVIRYGGTLPESHHITIGAYKFKELFEERSGGRVRVDVFTNNQIGGPRDLIEGLQMNNVQMCDNSVAALSGFTEKVLPLTLPFLFPSREIAFQFIEGEYGDRLVESIAADEKVRIAGWNENGYRQLTNSKHVVRTPDDIKGLKIRVMESPIYIKTFESFGSSPTPMSLTEMFTGMQQGTVDGQDNPVAVVSSNKFYEVQKYMSDLNHAFDFIVFLVSEEFYQSMPEDIRKTYDECMAEAMVYTKEVALQHEKDALEELQGLMEYTFLTEEERAQFKALTAPVYDWFKQEYPNEAGNLEEYMAEIARLNS